MASREEVKVEGLDGVIKTLQGLPPELVSRRGGVIRQALRKGAVVMQKQVIANLQAIVAAPNVGGEDRSTGFLEKNIAVTRGKPPAGQNGERYLLRVRNKAYPKKSPKAKTVTTAQVARLLEYGTERRQPYPFIRPAFELKKQESLDTIVAESIKGTERALKKLQRQNRVKD